MSSERESSSRRERLRRAVPIAIGVFVAALLVAFAVQLLKHKEVPRKAIPEVVQLKLIKPPPPPPPPPPPKVEPPKMKQELKVETPAPQTPSPAPKNDSPPALDAQANGPGDAFGLEGHPGGTGWGGTGGGGTQWGLYKARLKSCFEEALRRHRRFKDERTQVDLQVWMTPDGRPERVAIANSSGRKDIDELATATTTSVERCADLPPEMPPQPMYVRLGSRPRGAEFGN